MKKYKIGLYEKAMRSTLSWKEMLECTKDCGYDYMEISIDASEKRISRVYMSEQERKEIVDAMFETESLIQSMSVSALTKYAGDPNPEIRNRGMEIAVKSIEFAATIGIRTVMIPGYDIYFGESTVETKRYFLENIRIMAEVAERKACFLDLRQWKMNL